MARCHCCDTSHITKVYFMELHVKIKYVNFKDKILVETSGNVKDSRILFKNCLID